MRKILYLSFIVLLVAIASCATPTQTEKSTATGSKWILGTHSLSLPGKNWSLLLDLPGFRLEKEATRPDGSGIMLSASNPQTGVLVSVFLERRPDLGSTDACKIEYWGKWREVAESELQMSDVRHTTSGRMATVHSMVREFEGVPVMNKNVNGYLYHDGVCVDLHVSKVGYQPKDEALFDAVLASVRFSDETAGVDHASRTTMLARPPLVSVLNTPEHRWVFQHICVPIRHLPADGYTPGDFVEAYLAFYRARWEASMAAKRNGDLDASIKYFAPLLHSVIDLYWPNRVVRDSQGAILRFRDCDELGNLKGILRAERSMFGPSVKDLEPAGAYGGPIIGKWRDNRPFEEVEEILRSGPMKLAEPSVGVPLGGKEVGR